MRTYRVYSKWALNSLRATGRRYSNSMNSNASNLENGVLSQLVETVLWRPSTGGEEHDVEVRIEVYRLPSGRYQPRPSHKVQGPGQAGGYFSIDAAESVEEALESCIAGYQLFIGSPDETKWIPVEHS